MHRSRVITFGVCFLWLEEILSEGNPGKSSQGLHHNMAPANPADDFRLCCNILNELCELECPYFAF
jgi:hypothetical protein